MRRNIKVGMAVLTAIIISGCGVNKKLYDAALKESALRLERLERVRKELDESRREVGRLKAELRAKMDEIGRLESQLTERRNQVDELMVRGDEAGRELEERDNKVAELTDLVAEREVEIDSIKEALARRGDRIKELSGEVERLTAELEKMKGEIGRLNALLKEKDKDVKELERALTERSNEVDELYVKGIQMTKELKAINEEVSALTDRIAEREVEIDELSEKLKMRDERIRELSEDVEKANSELDRLKREAGGLKKSNEYLKREVERLSLKAGEISSEKRKELAELKRTYESIIKELKDEIKSGDVKVSEAIDRLSVKFVDKILFDSGRAEIKEDGKRILNRVGSILKGVKDREIRIEGHADIVPIGPRIIEQFPTNWELSTRRATNVVRYLQEKIGIDPHMMSASGYSKYRPVASNETKEGKAKNRRIEIVLVPKDIDRVLEEIKE